MPRPLSVCGSKRVGGWVGGWGVGGVGAPCVDHASTVLENRVPLVPSDAIRVVPLLVLPLDWTVADVTVPVVLVVRRPVALVVPNHLDQRPRPGDVVALVVRDVAVHTESRVVHLDLVQIVPVLVQEYFVSVGGTNPPAGQQGAHGQKKAGSSPRNTVPCYSALYAP